MTKKEVTQLSYEIVGIAIKIHKALGAGLTDNITNSLIPLINDYFKKLPD